MQVILSKARKKSDGGMARVDPLPDMPKTKAIDVDNSSPASPAGLRPSAVLRCRLCWEIALIVTFCIVVIEAVILIPSYVNYERDLLKRLEDVGLAAVQAGLAQRGTWRN